MRQATWKTLLGIAGIVICLVIAAYYATAASGHPRIKHMLLFIGLAGASALYAWFTLPPRDTGAG
jgi:hypothetical protein